MSILICDSDCELWYERADELGLKVIKMPYVIDGEERPYDLGRGEDPKEFFDKMRKGAKASTAALNGEDYREFFEPLFQAGEDMLYIAFSSKMSGTFNYLEPVIKELSEKYPDAKYKRFDTLSISMGAGIQVYLAAKYFNEGHTTDETYAYLESIRDKHRIYFAVDDLTYLKRGGRISPAAAAFGNILQLKPILKVGEEGELAVVSKEKGNKKALNYMLNTLFETEVDTSAPIVVLNADKQEDGDKIIAAIRERYGDGVEIWDQQIGPVIGAHCGPGTAGIIWMTK